jgi:Zn finger protein HypA/HybF involved in hydrogenase expression
MAWTEVPARDARYRRLAILSSRSKGGDFVPSPGEDLRLPELKRTVKAIRNISKAFTKCDQLWSRSAISTVQHYIARHSVKRVLALALGVGVFSHSSSAALLQMGWFLSLTQALRQQLSQEAVCLMYFDPQAGAFEQRCCDALGVDFGQENMRGAYLPPENHMVIAFMPHCGAALYHNLIVANLRAAEGPGELSADLCPLVIVGNDIRKYSVREEFCMGRLCSLFQYHVVPTSRSRKDGGIAGFSFTDVENAFSDMTVMTLDPQQPFPASGGKLRKRDLRLISTEKDVL